MWNKNPNTINFDIAVERISKIHSTQEPDLFRILSSDLVNNTAGGRDGVETAIAFLHEVQCSAREAHYKIHALRVALYYRRWGHPASAKGIVLSLLHNVLEVGGIVPERIHHLFGDWVSEGCQKLKLDRGRQKSDPGYLGHYYGNLQDGGTEVCQIKILDKLDNLLILFLNPSKNVRLRYLEEIETWLLPMVKKNLPQLKETFEKLILENRVQAETLRLQYAHATT